MLAHMHAENARRLRAGSFLRNDQCLMCVLKAFNSRIIKRFFIFFSIQMHWKRAGMG